MKDFSNETKKARRIAILKVILKRYSFVVWLPLSIYICEKTGHWLQHQGVFTFKTTSPAATWFGCLFFGLFFYFVLLWAIVFLIYSICVSVAFVWELIFSIKIKQFPDKIKQFSNRFFSFLKRLFIIYPARLWEKRSEIFYEKKRFWNSVEKELSKKSKTDNT